MEIISIRLQPHYKDLAIEYISSKWSTPRIIYEDCITHSITSDNYLPQWYLLVEDQEIIGCAGLITNDFISRMDLYPWLCALYIEEKVRGKGYGKLLIEKAKSDAKLASFKKIYLCTDLEGYYEKHKFNYIGIGYHPWEEESKIYEAEL